MKIFPYRWTFRNGLLNTLFFSPLRRASLLHDLKIKFGDKSDTVTVVIGVRNRSDYRLRNALWSLKNQDYPSELIKIVVVDYGSEPFHRDRIIDVCNSFDVNRITLPDIGKWNKPNCLNYAIKRCHTKFFLSSDVDVIFPDNYIAGMVTMLKDNPLSVVYSKMCDLPEEATDHLMSLEENNSPIDFAYLLRMTTHRGTGNTNAGINGTYTYFYQYVHAYDEFYEGWGSEDNDLQKRFQYLGLDIVSLQTKATFLHQWHPKGEGISDFHASALRNRKYYEKTNSIIRNLQQWGEVK